MTGLLLLALAAAPSEAAQLFNEGRTAMKAGDLPKACEAFSKSHALEPALGTLLNLATCYEKQGRFATAWLRFNDALAWAQRTHEADREAFARDRAAALRSKVSWVVLSSDVELTAQLDGQPVRVSRTPISVPVETGVHALVAEEPGHEKWTGAVEVKTAGATVTQVIPPLKQTAVGIAPTELVPFAAPPPTPPPAVSRREQAASFGLPLIGGGAAIAVVSVIGLAWSFNTYNTLQSQRVGMGGDPVVSRGELERMRWAYPLSWVGLAVGVAAAGVGATLLILGRPVSVTSTGTGVSFAGRF